MDQLYGTLSGGEQLDGVLTIPKTVGELGEKTITENGTYDASDDGYDGYSRVVASVPNTYTAGDEGKVVDNGALVSQTSATYTINNTYDTTLINSVTVNVSGGSTPTLETVTKTYTPTTSQQTETITPSSGYDGIGEVDVTVNAIPSQYIIPTGTKSISSNGTGIDVKAYEYADVAVPNSYSAADEGKVVSNGALVAQTAHADVTPTTSDQTIDTTLNNSLKVKGDADLVAGNIKKDVEIFGVTGSYEGGGGGWSDDDIATRNYTGAILLSNATTSISAYAFRNSSITSISGSGVTEINEAAFMNCSSLTSVNFPEVIRVGRASAGGHDAYVFYGIKIQTINLPKLTDVNGTYAFAAMGDSTHKVTIVLPSLVSVGDNTFRTSYIQALDIGEDFTTMKAQFLYQGALSVLILRNPNSVVTASASNAIQAVTSSTAVYVPNDLIPSYKTATGWSAKSASIFHAIEGSQYENYYADGTPIS